MTTTKTCSNDNFSFQQHGTVTTWVTTKATTKIWLSKLSPEEAVAQFAAVLNNYCIREVSGDRYGGEWPREQFRWRGVNYRPSERSKSAIYCELLPMINSGRVSLLSRADQQLFNGG
jgi:hypothetical protein